MINFILNDSTIKTDLPPGMTVLDFVRYQKHLMGTKIGCREGDCGACTVLIGEVKDDVLEYLSVTSCLMPLANVHGKHVVTIEGINFSGLSPVQQAMSDEGATQCGFCTPGFVMSITGFCMQDKNDDPVGAFDGNICRCTGYKSIERAAVGVASLLDGRGNSDPVEFAVEKKIIPDYFNSIKKRLQSIQFPENGIDKISESTVFVGGGTDLYVQKHETMVHTSAHYLSNVGELKSIHQEGNECVIGASCTVTDMMESALIYDIFPEFLKYSKLVSSTQIRNMATIGGNIVNASPIGDFTVFLLALNATIYLKDERKERKLLLKDFYKGYKVLDKNANEIITKISFSIPDKNTVFNFEKVSKRTNLDIASVNTAISLTLDGNKITEAYVSAGGVGPTPMFLRNVSAFLSSKIISEEIINEACVVAGDEITPISDVRGSAEYKRFLLQQLIRAHFIELIPGIEPGKLLEHAEY